MHAIARLWPAGRTTKLNNRTLTFATHSFQYQATPQSSVAPAMPTAAAEVQKPAERGLRLVLRGRALRLMLLPGRLCCGILSSKPDLRRLASTRRRKEAWPQKCEVWQGDSRSSAPSTRCQQRAQPPSGPRLEPSQRCRQIRLQRSAANPLATLARGPPDGRVGSCLSKGQLKIPSCPSYST